MDHSLGWTHTIAQTSLNEFKRTGIISSIFSDQNGMKLEINLRKINKQVKKDYMWNEQHETKKHGSTMKSKKKFKKYFDH